MRIAFGLAGLALSVIAIGACGEPDYKQADALTCAAYLPLLSAARSETRVAPSGAELEAASAFWLALAEQKYTDIELAQFFADSAHALEGVAAADLELISASCLAGARTA